MRESNPMHGLSPSRYDIEITARSSKGHGTLSCRIASISYQNTFPAMATVQPDHLITDARLVRSVNCATGTTELL